MTTTTLEKPVDVDLDALLLQTAAEEKVQKVDGRVGGSLQSHTARAWTMGGNVD